MDGSRRAFDPETEQGCDPFSERIGLAKMEAAGNLKRGARRIVDHDRDDGIAIGLRNQSVEPYRTLFGPAFGPVFGNFSDRKSVVWGQDVPVRVDFGCRRTIKKKQNQTRI